MWIAKGSQQNKIKNDSLLQSKDLEGKKNQTWKYGFSKKKKKDALK